MSSAARWAAAAVLAFCGLLGAAAPALAAGTLNVAVSADPVEGAVAQVTPSGTVSDANHRVQLTVKRAGGTACAANYDADDGERILSASASTSGSGPFTRTLNYTFRTAGDYLICGWLVDGSGMVVDTEVRPQAVRIPKLSLAVVAPASVAVSQVFQLTTTYQAETARNLSVYLLSDGGPGACPANANAAADADVQPVITNREIVGGPTAIVDNISLSAPGAYLACAYVDYQSRTTYQAFAQAKLTVQPPPPPCVVPALTRGTPLASALMALGTASCSPGPRKYTPSVTFPRGTVIKTTPDAGTSLPNAAAVTLVISTGKPCRVPRLIRGQTVSGARARLVRAGCTPGGRSTRRSRTRKGRVIGFTPGPGTRLSPRATVGIRVSRGRR